MNSKMFTFQNDIKEKSLKDLNEDIWIQIFGKHNYKLFLFFNISLHYYFITSFSYIKDYLDPYELLNITSVSKLFLKYSLHDVMLWKKHCINYKGYSDKFNLNRAKEINLFDRVKKIPLKELKKALLGSPESKDINLKKTDTTRCIEKEDWQRMLVASLIFNPRTSSRLSTNRGSYLPNWTLAMGDYKSSFFHNIRESRRSEIFMNELISIDWKLEFKHPPQNEDGEGHPISWSSKFHENHILSSSLHGQEWEWKFIRSSNYENNNVIDKRMIQVDHYPPLSSEKLPNGLWRLENTYVYFIQEKKIDLDEIPPF